MKVLMIILSALGVLFILSIIIKLISNLIIKKLTLSGKELVRYLRSDDHFIAIEPCPFCGYDTGKIIESDTGTFKMECSMCGASTREYDTPEEMLTAWDLRNGKPTNAWEFTGGNKT